MTAGRTRRWLLEVAASVVATVPLAGCLSDGDDPPGTTANGDPVVTTSGSEHSPTKGASGSLDLKEANVVDVSVEPSNGSYSFDVSLHHDDEGEEGYADWWQVERLDGTQLGRRDLLHPHAQQPFTRSATIDVPDDVACVVVRGHDQTHGYGGHALLVEVQSGATRAVDQRSDRQSFDESDCP